MKKLKNTIVIGAQYENQYGDIRIPVLEFKRNLSVNDDINLKHDMILYIEKRKGSEYFQYPMSAGGVSIGHFKTKFFLKKQQLTYTDKVLDLIRECILKTNLKYGGLCQESSEKITKLLKV